MADRLKKRNDAVAVKFDWCAPIDRLIASLRAIPHRQGLRLQLRVRVEARSWRLAQRRYRLLIWGSDPA